MWPRASPFIHSRRHAPREVVRGERTGVPFEKERVCGRPGVENVPRITLCPDDHVDPGLVSVRGLDWLGPFHDTKGHPMSIKLTNTQLVLLSAAAIRDDRCIVLPSNLKGGAAQKVAAKLIGVGLVKEIKAKAGAPVWRRDDQIGQSFALKLTTAGGKAITVGESQATNEASEERAREPVADIEAPAGRQDVPQESVVNTAANVTSGPAAPRSGTKIAQLIVLLQRDHGATLGELIAATGWLPHTTRAALTGLRKRGYAVAIDRSSKERGSTYRIQINRTAAGGKDTDRDGAARAFDPPAIFAEQPTQASRAVRVAASRARRAA